MKIFSGIQPTGQIHIGNYLGAIKQWIDLQNDAEQSIFCIVDLHAITVPKDPEELQKNIISLAALYLAAGIDPKKSSLFVQSQRPEHSELAWILNCFTNIGELKRMTQFKDKGGDSDSVSAGLFDYPVLMAADILLYGTTHVPVGDDQKQHVELTRDIAIRFNSKFGQIFTIPEPLIKKTSARIMGLDNPEKKMSKSSSTPNNYISMFDTADIVKQKIMRAVTDSGSEVKSGTERPAITNLLNIYHEVTGKEISSIEGEFVGKGYKEFKESLTEVIIEYLRPIQEKYNKIISSESEIKELLNEGANKVWPIATETLGRVHKAVGLGI
ncbi:MAG: tryptophan--tRNA ligase [Patescibacteria group bacterium]|jgi:tryptophanyl-tRNA synthetase